MSYPLPVVPDFSQYGIGYSVSTGRATPPMNLTNPPGATGSYTDLSTRSAGYPGNDESTRSLALFDAEMRPKSARIALFEKSVVTPGLTPAPGQREVWHIQTHSHSNCKSGQFLRCTQCAILHILINLTNPFAAT